MYSIYTCTSVLLVSPTVIQNSILQFIKAKSKFLHVLGKKGVESTYVNATALLQMKKLNFFLGI